MAMKFEEERNVIESYILGLIDVLGDGEWVDENTLRFFSDGDKSLGTLYLNDRKVKATGKKVQSVLQSLIDKKEEAEANELDPSDVEGTIFESLFDYKTQFGELHKDGKTFDELCKRFEEVGVKGFLVSSSSVTKADTVKSDLTIGLECNPSNNNSKDAPNGFFTRLKNSLHSTYGGASSPDSVNYVYTSSLIDEFEGEEVEEIRLDGVMVGRYYKERNFIHMYYNPFRIKKFDPIREVMPVAVDDFIKVLKRHGVENVDTSDIQEKIFVSSFLKSSRKELKKLKKDLERYEKDIDNYEENLQNKIRQYHETEAQVDFIKSAIDNKGDSMFSEIEEAKKLSFIDGIELETDSIVFKFIPATIRVDDFRRVDHSDSFGRRTMYLGKLEVTVSPNKFKVESSHPIEKYDGGVHAHPHVSTSGQPCFGEGDGRNKIYHLLARNQFTELAKMLWFWIKTYRNGGAYVKMKDTYDDRLRKGLPVWDDSGNRVELNDSDRIESGEQEELEKEDVYEDNIKEFEDVKVF